MRIGRCDLRHYGIDFNVFRLSDAMTTACLAPWLIAEKEPVVFGDANDLNFCKISMNNCVCIDLEVILLKWHHMSVMESQNTH